MSGRTLYLGLQPPPDLDGKVVHYPVIRIEPFDLEPLRERWADYTHLIFTSKTPIRLLRDRFSFEGKTCLAVGHKTGALLDDPIIAPFETAEGMVALLETLDLEGAYLLWPHSDLARPVLEAYLAQRGCRYDAPPIYTSVMQQPGPAPDLSGFDTLYFTSPSTVDGFLAIWPEIPKTIEIKAIGPVTQARLDEIDQPG